MRELFEKAGYNTSMNDLYMAATECLRGRSPEKAVPIFVRKLMDDGILLRYLQQVQKDMQGASQRSCESQSAADRPAQNGRTSQMEAESHRRGDRPAASIERESHNGFESQADDDLPQPQKGGARQTAPAGQKTLVRPAQPAATRISKAAAVAVANSFIDRDIGVGGWKIRDLNRSMCRNGRIGATRIGIVFAGWERDLPWPDDDTKISDLGPKAWKQAEAIYRSAYSMLDEMGVTNVSP